MESGTPSGNNPGKDIYNLELNSAMQHIKLAKQSEQGSKYEIACKHYLEASNKLMGLMRAESDEKKKEVFKKHLSDCINSAGLLKATVND